MNENKIEKSTVYDVTQNIIMSFSESLNSSYTKSTLANLRNSFGRTIGNTNDVWRLIFESVPSDFLSRDGFPTKEEKSIMTALQLFAVHQQGEDTCVHSSKYIANGNFYVNMGESLKCLRVDGNLEAVDKRFNAMITSSSFEELIEHLRHLVRLLKSKTDTKVNYAKLANDLFWFQKGFSDQIRFKWSQSYYRVNFTVKEKGE